MRRFMFFYKVSVSYEVLCHCERSVAISRKGYHIKPHARYFCTCVEKKAQTSKRVSVIVSDNVISKAQFAPCGVILSSTVILRCSDICPAGNLRINTLTSAESRNITLAYAKI